MSSTRRMDKVSAAPLLRATKIHGLGLLLLLVLVVTVNAALANPIYRSDAVGCVYRTSSGEGAQFVLVGGTDCVGGLVIVDAAASASEFGLGVGVDAQSFGVLGGGQALATVDTTFRIDAPAGSPALVTTSLNLHLTSGIGGGSTSQGNSTRQIEFNVNIGPYQLWSIFAELWRGSAGLSYFYVGNIPQLQTGYRTCTPCEIVTTELVLPVNTDLNFDMRLYAVVENGGIASGFVSALNTLYFPSDGPVFNNLPEGYSATIFGLNVENNRVVRGDDGGPNGVPEPGSLALLGIGLVGLIGATRRRQNR